MTPQILQTNLPVPPLRRLQPEPERQLYVARAGLGALPSGLGTMLLFILPQIFSFEILLWAIWWPAPSTAEGRLFAWGCTLMLVAALALVGWALTRRFRGFASAVLRAPFTRITVTDRRVLWTLPWARRPLMEIARNRIVGGILGTVDRRGRGNAAIMLVDGDPSADIDGNIHFDRLPDVVRFVEALA